MASQPNRDGLPSPAPNGRLRPWAQRRSRRRCRNGSPEAAAAAQGDSRPEPAGNEFVIFSKPELGRLNSADLAAVWDLFAGSFADYDVTVHRVKIMTGPELDRPA